MEFLVYIEVEVPPDLADGELERLKRAETTRAAELATAGTLRRLWRETGPAWTNWGLWSARDGDQLNQALGSLPLRPYMTIQVWPLTTHPSDPLANPTRERTDASAAPATKRRELEP